MSNNLPHALTGITGEYYVAAKLSRLGYIASITLRNTQGIDLLVSNQKATRQLAIQVKSNQNDKREWILNTKAEQFVSDTLFYVFVNLVGPSQLPEFFVVPTVRMWLNLFTYHTKNG